MIYCSVTGFGQTGPYAPRAGYDLMAQGMGGFMGLTGTADGEPTRAGVPIADIFTGVYSVVGILAALARAREDRPRRLVDTALVDTQVGVLANQALNYLVSGERAQAHRQCASQHRALSGVPGRRRPHHHRDRQRQPVSSSCATCSASQSSPTSRTTRTTRAGSRIARNWSRGCPS